MKTPASLLMRLRNPAETAAWSRFVRLYTPLLYFWTSRLNVQGQDADDMVQDVFLILVQKLPGFAYDPNKSFRGWLRTILLNRYRAGKRKTGVPAIAHGLRADDLAEPDPAAAIEESEYRRYVVGRALRLMQAEFEPATWQACWEYAVRGRNAAVVAAELGVSIAVVYSAKSRILRRLREELADMLR